MIGSTIKFLIDSPETLNLKKELIKNILELLKEIIIKLVNVNLNEQGINYLSNDIIYNLKKRIINIISHEKYHNELKILAIEISK